MKNELGALMLWIDRKLNRNQDVLVTKIDSIQNLFETSSEASASAADILEGKTAFNGTVLMTGIMENQGAKEATLLAGGTYNIPRGYHDGAGRVMATDLASQTPGTADAGGILSGLKAWVAGKLIDGAMKDRRGVTVTAASVAQDNEYTYLTIPEEGCYDANSKVRTINSNIFDIKTYRDETVSCGDNLTLILPQKPNVFIALIGDWAFSHLEAIGQSTGMKTHGASLYDVKAKKILVPNGYSGAGRIVSFDDTTRKLTFNFDRGTGITVWYC
ncbi:MAG: hypothetical protein K2I96_04275 [Lachnospiraceae bacterium]|nr:hypothetical protein [Lachnospiraceae bacterium]